MMRPIAGADDGFFTLGRSAVIPKAQLLVNDRDGDGDPLTIINAAPEDRWCRCVRDSGGRCSVSCFRPVIPHRVGNLYRFRWARG